ncbi:hypothetical protein STEG23_037371 [Scotinomys teguina]
MDETKGQCGDETCQVQADLFYVKSKRLNPKRTTWSEQLQDQEQMFVERISERVDALSYIPCIIRGQIYSFDHRAFEEQVKCSAPRQFTGMSDKTLQPHLSCDISDPSPLVKVLLQKRFHVPTQNRLVPAHGNRKEQKSFH